MCSVTELPPHLAAKILKYVQEMTTNRSLGKLYELYISLQTNCKVMKKRQSCYVRRSFGLFYIGARHYKMQGE